MQSSSPSSSRGRYLATNTSSIEIEVLAGDLREPGRLVGIHFFNPVPQMQLVEIVQGAATSAEPLRKALWFTRKLDKLPLPCKSAPGFVVNRILMPYIIEALFALAEGIPAAVIDKAGTRFRHARGPDRARRRGRLGRGAARRRLCSPRHSAAACRRSWSKRVEEKKLGRKNGEGFYVWRDGKAVRESTQDLKVPADLEDRLILPMLNEAVAALREGVVEDADLLDAGAIFATGFAPFRGGPLQYAKSRGISQIVERLTELSTRYGERFRPDAGWSQLSGGDTPSM